jgi:hypothetical protein
MNEQQEVLKEKIYQSKPFPSSYSESKVAKQFKIASDQKQNTLDAKTSCTKSSHDIQEGTPFFFLSGSRDFGGRRHVHAFSLFFCNQRTSFLLLVHRTLRDNPIKSLRSPTPRSKPLIKPCSVSALPVDLPSIPNQTKALTLLHFQPPRRPASSLTLLAAAHLELSPASNTQTRPPW